MSDESAEKVMKHKSETAECDDNISQFYRLILIFIPRRRQLNCSDNCANKQRLKSNYLSECSFSGLVTYAAAFWAKRKKNQNLVYFIAAAQIFFCLCVVSARTQL